MTSNCTALLHYVAIRFLLKKNRLVCWRQQQNVAFCSVFSLFRKDISWSKIYHCLQN